MWTVVAVSGYTLNTGEVPDTTGYDESTFILKTLAVKVYPFPASTG
jgi:hypothetical protein